MESQFLYMSCALSDECGELMREVGEMSKSSYVNSKFMHIFHTVDLYSTVPFVENTALHVFFVQRVIISHTL